MSVIVEQEGLKSIPVISTVNGDHAEIQGVRRCQQCVYQYVHIFHSIQQFELFLKSLLPILNTLHRDSRASYLIS